MGNAIGEIGAAGIQSATDLATNAATNATNAAMNKRTNETNQAINAANIKASENAATTAYNRQIEQWQRENEYNSPVNQRALYEAAGLNYAVHSEGGTQVNGASTPSVPQQNIPSSIPMQPYRLDTFQPGQAMANIFAALSKGKADISQSRLNETQNTQLQDLFTDTLKGVQLDNKRKELENMWLPLINSGKLQENAAQVFALYNKAMLDAANTEFTKAETALSEARKITEQWRAKEAKIVADTTYDTIMQQIKESKSRETSNYASASAANAQAAKLREETSQLQDMHQDIVTMQHNLADKSRFDKELTAYEVEKYGATIADQIQQIKQHTDIGKQEIERLETLVAQAKKENKLYYWQRALDALEQINNGITNWIPFAPDKETHDYVRYIERDKYGNQTITNNEIRTTKKGFR